MGSVCPAGPDAAASASAAEALIASDWLLLASSSSRLVSRRRTTKNKLMKKVETKKIPSYKWVVEDLCGKCEGNCLGAAVPADAELPPPPLTDVPLKFVRLDAPATPAP